MNIRPMKKRIQGVKESRVQVGKKKRGLNA